MFPQKKSNIHQIPFFTIKIVSIDLKIFASSAADGVVSRGTNFTNVTNPTLWTPFRWILFLIGLNFGSVSQKLKEQLHNRTKKISNYIRAILIYLIRKLGKYTV